ncbi:MAG TPA: hypothetical protein VHW23_06410 [Kofleriaceae bacterium]|nr:hypothetical protein [Kofleriaceae bacterium]
MPAIQHLLQRWGFVKLRRYGLELTPDGRILSTRNAILDDGTGGPVVGWQDGDVSIWKLSRWAAAQAVGSAVATPAVPAGPAKPASAKVEAAVVAPPNRPSARVIPAAVAGEPVVDEDDWEWTIALARARVAVEEAEVARPPAVALRPETRRAPTPVEPARPEPAAALPERPTLRSSATADLAASGDWRKSDSMDAIDTAIEASAYEDFRISTRPTAETPRGIPLPRVVAAAAGSPNTVIPVPALPTVDATRRARLEPVVRTPSSAAAANRFAKGTAPLDPPEPPTARPAAMVVEDTIPNLSVGDRTRPGIAPASRRMGSNPGASLGEPVAPPVGDRTRPGIALPPAARAVELPSIKRRNAR